MGYRSLALGTFITLFAILIDYKNIDSILHKRLENILQGLERLENSYHVKEKPRVVVGYGVCADVFVDAKDILKYSEGIGNPKHFDQLNTYEEVLTEFAYFFQHGAAAERSVANATLFNQLVSKAKSISSSYKMIGGNAALMAKRFYKENYDVILAAGVSKSLREMIPKGVKVLVTQTEDEDDDVHLILEYKRGETWGPYTSPRANRFIIHHDMRMGANYGVDQLRKELPEFKPHLFVVSGLQMMDNNLFDDDYKAKILSEIYDQMKDQPLDMRVHFEMASYVDKSLLSFLKDFIIPHSDSLGMNEQEVVNLNNYFNYGNVSLVTDSTPRVATVLDQMRSLFKSIRQHQKTPRKLSRIHVHTLAYQIIFTVENGLWKNTARAAAKASLTAHRYVCGSNEVNIDKAMLIMDESFSTSSNSGMRIPLDENKPVSCWKETVTISKQEKVRVDVCVAPVLVCTQVIKTAGGGDNISGAGLAPQI